MGTKVEILTEYTITFSNFSFFLMSFLTCVRLLSCTEIQSSAFQQLHLLWDKCLSTKRSPWSCVLNSPYLSVPLLLSAWQYFLCKSSSCPPAGLREPMIPILGKGVGRLEVRGEQNMEINQLALVCQYLEVTFSVLFYFLKVTGKMLLIG